jgi:hypothetical protein
MVSLARGLLTHLCVCQIFPPPGKISASKSCSDLRSSHIPVCHIPSNISSTIAGGYSCLWSTSEQSDVLLGEEANLAS